MTLCVSQHVKRGTAEYGGVPATHLRPPAAATPGSLPYGRENTGTWRIVNWPSKASIVLPMIMSRRLEVTIPLRWKWWYREGEEPPYIVVEVSPPAIYDGGYCRRSVTYSCGPNCTMGYCAENVTKVYVVPQKFTICIDDACKDITMSSGYYYGASPWSLYKRYHDLGFMRAAWFKIDGSKRDYTLRVVVEALGGHNCESWKYGEWKYYERDGKEYYYEFIAVSPSPPIVGGVINIAGAYINTGVCAVSFPKSSLCPDYDGAVEIVRAAPGSEVEVELAGRKFSGVGAVSVPAASLTELGPVVDEEDTLYRLSFNATALVTSVGGVVYTFPLPTQTTKISLCGNIDVEVATAAEPATFCCPVSGTPIVEVHKPAVSIRNVEAPSTRVCPGGVVPVAATLSVEKCPASIRFSVPEVGASVGPAKVQPGEARVEARLPVTEDWWLGTVGPLDVRLGVAVERVPEGLEAKIAGPRPIRVDSRDVTIHLPRLPTPAVEQLHVPSAARPGYPATITMIFKNDGECRGKFRARAVDQNGVVWFDQTYSLDPGDTATLQATPEMVGYDSILALSIDVLSQAGEWVQRWRQQVTIHMSDVVALYLDQGLLVVRPGSEPTRVSMLLAGSGIDVEQKVSLEEVSIPVAGRAALIAATLQPGEELTVRFNSLDLLYARTTNTVTYVKDAEIVDKDTNTVTYTSLRSAALLPLVLLAIKSLVEERLAG